MITEIVKSKIGYINTSMMNRFIIIISMAIKYAVNLLFKNGFPLGAFIPLEFDLGVLELSLHDGYLLFQTTPRLVQFRNYKLTFNNLTNLKPSSFENAFNRDQISKLLSNVFSEQPLLSNFIPNLKKLKKHINFNFTELLHRPEFARLRGLHEDFKAVTAAMAGAGQNNNSDL